MCRYSASTGRGVERKTRGSRGPAQVGVRPEDAGGSEHRNARLPGRHERWDTFSLFPCVPLAIADEVARADPDASEAGAALLYGAVRLRAGEPRRAGLQGKRRHHADPARGRELVRGQRQRQNRLLPAVVRASHRSVPLSSWAPTSHSLSFVCAYESVR
uniref:(northern house mosquito) hypothetical protein n=1 Tax=Culex pipiens TaxID=7175 RepID=A0A8D8KST6_CULPI